MFIPLGEWLPAFLLTLCVEIPVALLALSAGRTAIPRTEIPRAAVIVVLANLATHPVVWFVLTQVLLVGTPAYTAVAEAWAVVVEALFYAVAITGIRSRRAIAVAVVANGASFVVGRVWYAFGGGPW